MRISIGHILFPMLIISILAFMEWYSRMVFLSILYPRKYGHGKSAKRARKHYKANWTLFQRLLWIPMFKEKYSRKYVLFPLFSFIQLLTGVITLILFVVFTEANEEPWVVSFIIFGSLMILRILYNNAVAKGIW